MFALSQLYSKGIGAFGKFGELLDSEDKHRVMKHTQQL